MFKESKHISFMITMLLVLVLALFGCSKGERESQTADTEAAISEKSEHVHADVPESAAESDAWNKICPVCGGEVNAELETVTYDGKVYGFGCPGCPEKFSESPQDYVKNLNEDGTEYIGS